MPPNVVLECDSECCGGDRWFSPQIASITRKILLTRALEAHSFVIRYKCDNCDANLRDFAIRLQRIDDGMECVLIKFGELAPHGKMTPPSVIKLVGPDRDLFLAGRRCENQGMGLGAFSYYRRIVERQKDRLIDALISVSQKTNNDQSLIAKLKKSKTETQFSRALEMIGDGIPQALKIDGHNPLKLMHDALSDGIHALDDKECLQIAEALRIVLTRFAERCAEIIRDEAELKGAISKLMSRGQKIP